jgi:hypothetical protein
MNHDEGEKEGKKALEELRRKRRRRKKRSKIQGCLHNLAKPLGCDDHFVSCKYRCMR